MALTTDDKDYWKKQIQAEIDFRIRDLVSTNQKDYLQRTAKLAYKKAIERLGIEKNLQHQAEIKAKIDDLGKELNELRMKALNSILYPTEKELAEIGEWHFERRLNEEIQKAAISEESSIMGNDQLGRLITKLRSEKSRVIFEIQLATSLKEIQKHWKHIKTIVALNPSDQSQAVTTYDE